MIVLWQLNELSKYLPEYRDDKSQNVTSVVEGILAIGQVDKNYLNRKNIILLGLKFYPPTT